MPPAVAVICPLYGRPDRTAAFVDGFKAAATGPQHIILVCNEDRDDDIAAARATDATVLILPGTRQPGDWGRKINAAYRFGDEPIMVLCGDDVRPIRGWYDEVLNAYRQGWGVIGTQDLGNRFVLQGLHSTHPAVARWYADEHGTVDGPGAVVAEVYHHNYVDSELVETAKARGMWVFCNNAILEHLHHRWGKAQNDWVYDLGQRDYEIDRWCYTQRSHRWSSLSPLPRTAVTVGSD